MEKRRCTQYIRYGTHRNFTSNVRDAILIPCGAMRERKYQQCGFRRLVAAHAEGQCKSPFSATHGRTAYATIGVTASDMTVTPFLLHNERIQNMDEDERTNQSEEMNEENDAREEDIVEDTDSDTEDVVENDDANESVILQRIDALETTMSRILGGIDALREAQSVMVENGATIIDDTVDEDIDLGIDDFVSPTELDLML